MKKQLITILASSLLLVGLTACSAGGAGAVTEDQSSASSPANESGSSESAGGALESRPTGNVRAVYGQTEIPDIPCESEEPDGRANPADAKAIFAGCLDSMEFERHTVGDYTVKLVGDTVRTDKANFPNNIYVRDLRAVLEKNGTELESHGDYGEEFLLMSASYLEEFLLMGTSYSEDNTYCKEYTLFADKLGSYLDIYELEKPVIAMRYFFGDTAGKNITRTVKFAVIQDDGVDSDFSGKFARGTGVWTQWGVDGDQLTRLFLTSNDGNTARAGVFAADEFEIADSRTLIDNEAKLKYVFDFGYDPHGKDRCLYTTEKTVKDEPKETVRGVYGETEIPDIPCGDPDYDGKASSMHDWNELDRGLDSMVFETHTIGEYTINLVGKRVRTDEAHFPDNIYVGSLGVEVERDGKVIGGGNSYWDILLYGAQFQREYIVRKSKIGNYVDVYDMDDILIAMRYFFDDDPRRTVRETVSFVTIHNGEVFPQLLGTGDKGTVADYAENIDNYHKDTWRLLSYKDKEWGGMAFLTAADELKQVGDNTLIDEAAGLKYIFDFSDEVYQTDGRVATVRWISEN